MSLPSEGMKDLLVTAGYTFGGSGDWAVYIGKMPSEKQRLIAIYDSGGLNPDPRWLIDYPSVQIRMQGQPNDYQEAREEAELVKGILLGTPSQDLNGDRWVSIIMNGDIGFLGYNTLKCPEFSMNFSLIIEPAPAVTDNRKPLP